MKKQITIKELKSLIKEGVQKLKRRALLENEKKALQEELGTKGGLEFEIGDEIENGGNDGEFYTMDGEQNYVERRGDLSGKIVGIKDGYYILKATGGSEEFVDTFKVRIGYPYYRKKLHANERGRIEVKDQQELLDRLHSEYSLYNIEKTGSEGSWYYWTKEDEDMVGAYFQEKGEMWYKPMSEEKKGELWDRPSS